MNTDEKLKCRDDDIRINKNDSFESNVLKQSDYEQINDEIIKFYKNNQINFEDNLSEICRKLGFIIFTSDLSEQSLDAMILVADSRKEIFVDASLNAEEQKFVLAFELCRFIDNKEKPYFAFKDDNSLHNRLKISRCETKLDYMVSTILIPEKTCRKEIDLFLKKNKISDESVAKFVSDESKKFGVSSPMIIRRLSELLSNYEREI